MNHRQLSGAPTGGGIVIGRACVLDTGFIDVPRYYITEGEVAGEHVRLDEGRAAVERELQGVADQLPHDAPAEARALLDVQMMLLNDAALIEAARDRVVNERINVEWAISETAEALVDQFRAIDDPYLKERGRDVEQVAGRLLNALSGSGSPALAGRVTGEPLIFVEVALLPEMAASIPPLLDEAAAAADPQRASVAIFYSISNTQPGLKGVGFGDSLIKRVVEALRAEFPQLKTFATLSPIPGLRAWLQAQAADLLAATPARTRQALARHCSVAQLDAPTLLQALDGPAALDEKSAPARWLLAAAARYLGRGLDKHNRPLDAVARFHLGNGARVERINWLGDPSPKGRKQSYGLMVNYLYDLKRLDKHRALLAQGKIPLSSAVESLQD